MVLSLLKKRVYSKIWNSIYFFGQIAAAESTKRQLNNKKKVNIMTTFITGLIVVNLIITFGLSRCFYNLNLEVKQISDALDSQLKELEG